MNREEFIDRVYGGLIILCQASPGKPLYTEEGGIIPLMAKAAQRAGATGLGANFVGDTKRIKEVVDLLVVGITKRDYPSEKPYITPITREVDESVEAGVEAVVLDCTLRPRHDGRAVAELIKEIKAKYPSQLSMADAPNLGEAENAYKASVDFVGTTLSGYTEESFETDHPDFDLIKVLVDDGLLVVAEGKVHTSEQLKQIIDTSPAGVVVGGVITRPLQTAKIFISVLER